MDNKTFNYILDNVKEIGIVNIINNYYHNLKFNKILKDISKCRVFKSHHKEIVSNRIIHEYIIYENLKRKFNISYQYEQGIKYIGFKLNDCDYFETDIYLEKHKKIGKSIYTMYSPNENLEYKYIQMDDYEYKNKYN